MANAFFTSWELWQQMTFVLAMSIVAVFCAGLGKSWRNSRLMKKQEALDLEKRARIEELRKTGLPMKRSNPVPFGIRAIQSGVEVDGIWISRPGSVSDLGEKTVSSATLPVRDIESQQKQGGRDSSADGRSPALNVTTTAAATASSDRKKPARAVRPHPSAPHRQTIDADSIDSDQDAASPPPPIPRSAKAKQQQQSYRPSPPSSSGNLDDDALQRLEGRSRAAPRPHLLGTYVPTSPRHRHNTPAPPGPQCSSTDRSSSPAPSSSADSFEFSPARGGSATHLGMPMQAPGPTFGPGDMHFLRVLERPDIGSPVPHARFSYQPAMEMGRGEYHSRA
ncbi:hypothetical protein VTJ83DRAFT_2020 [Remersonia thermophila]|uniref:Uncharacterized protein n=1 Tax=Remersonia thermophila TaxID=72144 RepID=A0ABR4DHI9_9PEZI